MFVISTRNFPPEIGGMQNLIGGLANELVNHGPVTVFADKTDRQEEYDKVSQATIERFGGFKLFRKYRKANRISEFIKENQSIRSIFFDHWKSVEKINLNNIKNIPSFCLIHSKEINHEKGTSSNKRVLLSLEKVKFIIANSRFTKTLAINVGLPEKKIHIIHPGHDEPVDIDKKFINETKKIYGDSFPKIITVARLEKRKNHQNILMCIRNLKEKFPKIKYIIVGDGDEKKKLLSLVHELRLEKEVIFLNNIDQKFKISLIQTSDLFLMPSIKYKRSVEGFGISFIEAASYGVGSIGGRDGGAEDAIINNETGLICDGQDIGSIYNSIVEFFRNDNYKKFGSSAIKFSEHFTWKKIIRQYLDLI